MEGGEAFQELDLPNQREQRRLFHSVGPLVLKAPSKALATLSEFFSWIIKESSCLVPA